MDVERDEITQNLSHYARKILYGDRVIDEIPKKFRKDVIEELKNNGLEYLVE